MIKNFIIEKEWDSLQQKKAGLVKRYNELQQELQSIGIPTSKVHSAKYFYDERTVERRRQASLEFNDLKKQLGEVNAEIKAKHSEKESVKNKSLLKLFREIFSEEQIVELYKENERRVAGEQPIRVSFDWKNLDEYKEKSRRYKKVATEQLEKMIQFRIMLTGLIEQGCEKFGDAEFLKFISPLNRLIIPIKELEKIKRDMFLQPTPRSDSLNH